MRAPVPLEQQRRSPTHPGEMFRLEFRPGLELSQAAAARALGWSANRMNEFETGKRGVTVENAIDLSVFTKTTPQFWLNLQMEFDLWHAYQARKRSLS